MESQMVSLESEVIIELNAVQAMQNLVHLAAVEEEPPVLDS